jgi:23S rRNA (guanosine2251-2'-O)-methyltransferase
MEQENYIFGIRAIEEAILAGKIIDKIVAKKGLNGELFNKFAETCKKHNIRIQFTTPDVLNRITSANHQGVIAFLSKVDYLNNIHEIFSIAEAKGEAPFVIILDGITDVRNLGAIARSAECAGVHAIIVPQKGSAPINGESVKTSAGALHHIPICMTNNAYFAAKTLKDNGVQLIGATEKGAKPYYEHDFSKPTAIIMGAEDKGISAQLLKLCDSNALIPMHGHIESLNVSVAAGIILFEAAKQRH